MKIGFLNISSFSRNILLSWRLTNEILSVYLKDLIAAEGRGGDRVREQERERERFGCDLMSFDSLVFGIESVEALLY